MFWYYFHDPSANRARARGFQSWHIKFFSLWKITLFFNFAQISILGNFTTFFYLWIQGHNLYIFQIFINPPPNNSQKSKLKDFEQKNLVGVDYVFHNSLYLSYFGVWQGVLAFWEKTQQIYLKNNTNSVFFIRFKFVNADIVNIFRCLMIYSYTLIRTIIK